MNKTDKSKHKSSGPKDIKPKGSGFKDSISDKALGDNNLKLTPCTAIRGTLETVLNKPMIFPNRQNWEDYDVSTNISEVVKQFDQVCKKLLDFIRESTFEKIEIALNADISLSDFFNNKLLITQTIEKGIPYSIFESIKDVTPFTTDNWAFYLGLSSRSLNRYFIQNKTFSPIYSEKIIELIEVFKLGWEVFGDQNSFNQWLNTPNFALGNTKPYELLKNSYGKEMVISELTGISHGILV